MLDHRIAGAELFLHRGRDLMKVQQLGVGGAREALAQIILRLVAMVEKANQLVHQLVLGAEVFVHDCEG